MDSTGPVDAELEEAATTVTVAEQVTSPAVAVMGSTASESDVVSPTAMVLDASVMSISVAIIVLSGWVVMV